MVNGYLAGVMEDSLQNSIRLQTGHVQVRAASYPDGKRSLQWQDLLEDPETVAAQACGFERRERRRPRLVDRCHAQYANQSMGLVLYGVDATSELAIRN